MDLELRHLRVVVAIAKAGSVTKAAAELGVAQPALTGQLRRIERTFGGPLFWRDHRGVRTTTLGDLVVARAQLLLPAMSGLLDDAARLLEPERPSAPEHLTVGSSTASVLGPLIQRLTAEHPELGLATTATWSSDEIGRALDEGRVDFGVVGTCGGSGPPGGSSLQWRTYAVDPVFVLLPPDHPAADRPEVSLADLADVDWAATPGDGCFRECFAAACAREGFAPRSLFEADAASCIDLVASGTAVALCQATRVLPGLVTVPLRDAPLRWEHVVGWDPASPAARFAPDVVAATAAVHRELVARSDVYSAWLDTHPELGPTPTSA